MLYAMLYIGRFFHISFALFHLFFPLIFNWQKQLKKINTVNSAIMKLMNHFIIYLCIGVAVISFIYTDIYTDDLLTTSLGKGFLLMVATLWYLRAIEQLIYLPINHPVSFALFIMFIFGGSLYFVPYILS